MPVEMVHHRFVARSETSEALRHRRGGRRDVLLAFHPRGEARSPLNGAPSYLGAAAGGRIEGPLLLPGSPGTFDASGCEDELPPDPVVPADEFGDGPFLLPGWPGIPAPEFPGGTFTAMPAELPWAEGFMPVGAVTSVTAVT